MSRRPGWLPNQHGAWAMLISPYLVGVAASGFVWSHLLLLAVWLVGYFAFFATSLWLRSGRRAKWFPPVRAYVLATSVLGLALVASEPRLLGWVPWFGVPTALALWAAAHRRERDLLVGLLTVAGSALMTPVAYALGADPSPGFSWSAGQLSALVAYPLTVPAEAWLLAAVQAGYFGGAVFYVKSVIRERGNTRFLVWSLSYHLFCLALSLVAAWRWSGAGWALAPISMVLLWRAWWVWRRVDRGDRVTPRAIGVGEIFATLAVGIVCLVAAARVW